MRGGTAGSTATTVVAGSSRSIVSSGREAVADPSSDATLDRGVVVGVEDEVRRDAGGGEALERHPEAAGLR